MKSYNSSSDRDTRKILLVGDVGKAFLDAGAIAKERCEVCASMLDAIDAAAKNDFAGIGIVMFGMSAKLSSSLRVLRDSCDAKIVLLAQMYEEPIAIRLVGSACNGTSVADGYLICPVQPDRFYESIMTTEGRSAAEVSLSAPVDATIEMKIKHLERLATEDDLTGLKNRRYIWEFSRQIIERARKENGRVTLLVFDIDDLKHYNDLHGHCAGDEVLKQAAVLMRRCCRGHDVVGRIGGDEFAVVFWDEPQAKPVGAPAGGAERRSARAEHPKEAIFIAKRFVRELEKSELPALAGLGPEGKGVLTISGGLASFPRDGSTIQELFQQADKALLEAKRSGKNRIYLVGKPQSDIADIE
ncbi:MAG: GGDEF domain-containing protein [Planctomycetes bacterium]|nr:GGDEF domain-containing protein [Planctomycetota bacterium]